MNVPKYSNVLLFYTTYVALHKINCDLISKKKKKKKKKKINK